MSQLASASVPDLATRLIAIAALRSRSGGTGWHWIAWVQQELLEAPMVWEWRR